MTKVRLMQRHGQNEAGSTIELSKTQAQWMVNNGHAEFVGKGDKDDRAPRTLNAGPAEKATTDGSVEIMAGDDDPVKVVDTSPEPEKPADSMSRRKPGRPRKSES